jgi:dinuclear metal center YbgI/SA1388 family protein
MYIRDIIQILENIAPPHLQEAYDNSGLLVGHPDTPLRGVLCCLDSTEAVLQEAIHQDCNLIIAHHPIVFKGLRRFNGATYVERTIIQAIKHGIAVYALHTNLDNVLYQGVNEAIAQRIGLRQTRLLRPRPGSDTTGAGILGSLPQPMSELDALRLIQSAFQTPCIRHTALRNLPVETIAVCGGAGSFLLPDARMAGADLFLTSDFKYHEFFDAEGDLIIADIGHYESEQFTIELIFSIIQKEIPTFALHCTAVNTNPVHYLL